MQFDSLRAQIRFKISKILWKNKTKQKQKQKKKKKKRKKKKKKCLLIKFDDVMILRPDQGPIMVQISLVSAGSNPDMYNFQHFFPKSLHTKNLS